MRKVIVLDNPAIIDFVHDLCPEFVGAQVTHPDKVTYLDVDGADVVGRLPFEMTIWCGRYRRVEFDGAPRPLKPDATLEEVLAAEPRLSSYTVFCFDRGDLAHFLRGQGLSEYAMERLFPDLA